MEEQKYEELLPNEEEDDLSNDDLFNITSWGSDPSVRELITMYKDGDIIKPELQRKYVWDKKDASRFIESILLGLPIPSIFLANRENETRLIIDGYQRIRSIVDFKSGIWSKNDSSFILEGKINKRWEKKTYEDLTCEDKRRFNNYTIHAIVFEQKSPKNDSGLFQIFERINTSGKPLNAQEIRNCVSQGKMNNLLFELNKNKHWRKLYGDDTEDSRMKDLEYILRFFTLKDPELDLSVKSISLKKSLNDFMDKYKEGEQYIFDNFKSDFLNCIDFIFDKFGTTAFFNLQNDLNVIRRKFHPTIFDSLMIATSIALKNGYVGERNLENKRLELLKDSEYRECIYQGTMLTSNIKKRINKCISMIYEMNPVYE